MFIALNLIAMALGYHVFIEASKEKKDARTVGRLIGVFIVTAALGTILLAFAEWSAANCLKRQAYQSGCHKPNKICFFKSKL